ncbi:hypothetical protein [Brevibacillus sp. AY1]|uniref:hypothetical protein n=1 Tax=Brevibacillus sp. AY1 TaxID=2807621 RepID=UPI002455397A|nr:hypothetical protein [Brevibacillus sp. AY1]
MDVISVGDQVVFLRDGARGIVMRIQEGKCLVLWEDEFVSWESVELLRSAQVERSEQRM